jgi:hypothetical protein
MWQEAVILLARVMPREAGELSKILAGKLMFEGRPNDVVASALVNMKNPPINEMLARAKSVDDDELLTIGFVLAKIGERALDPVIVFCAQDRRAMIKGFAILGVFGNRINRGASDPEEIMELARIEAKLRGPKVRGMLYEMASSNDEQLREHARLFGVLMKLV